MTDPAPPPPIFPVQQSWFKLRKFLIRGFWVGVCLTVSIVLWLLWYVSNHGFARKWRYVLVEEIAKSGLPVTIERLTLNPLRGLAAQNVRIMDARVHGRPVAVIDEVVLDINYSNLLHHEPFINAIDLCDAAVSLPLNPGNPDTERIDVTGLKARILLPPHQLYVAQAEADINGVHVTASGRLMNPEKLTRSPQATQSRKKSGAFDFRRGFKALESLKLTGGKPVLELNFEGDLEQPSQIFAKATLRADRFTVGGKYPVKSARVGAVYSDGVVRLEQCSLVDAGGAFDATGTFNPMDGKAAFQVRSTVDLPAFARVARLAPTLGEVSFDSPPLLELSAEVDLRSDRPGFHGKVLGRVATGRFHVKSNGFDSGAADFSWDGERWYLHEVRIKHRSGDLVFDAMQTPGDFRFSIDSRLNPKIFMPLLPPETRGKLSMLQFLSNPQLRIEGSSPSPSLESLEIHGQAILGATCYRGVGINSAVVNFSLKDDVLTFRDFQIQRPEGSGSGSLVYNLKTDLLQLEGVRTTLVPTDVTSTFDPELTENLAPYRFKKRPALFADGPIDCRKDHMERTRLHVEIDSASGMDYTFIRRNLSLSKIKANLLIAGDRLKISKLEGGLLGGTVRADMDFSLRKSKGDYTVELRTENIDFPSLTKLYLDYDASKGRLTGSFNFSGKHDLARQIKGKGQLTVNNGNVFAIPLFGPLSGVMNGLAPGVGYNLAHKGTCSFAMEDGVVTTDDLNVAGKGFSMLGKGKLYIVDDKIDFTVRLAAQGPAGVLLSPVSKLLEYTADNTLSNPNWRPKRLPKGLFGPKAETLKKLKN